MFEIDLFKYCMVQNDWPVYKMNQNLYYVKQ